MKFLIVPLLIGGCHSEAHLSFLDPQGPIAAVQRWHFIWVLGIMVVLVAGPIFLLLPIFIWRYRYGAKTPRPLPAPRYTPKWKALWPLEFACWAGPVLIVILLAVFVWRDSHRLDPYKPIASAQAPLHVQVIGYDWKWLFIYPDQHVASVGTMVLPVGRPVRIQLTSATVMQSFFIPALGSQIYAMGGMVTQLNLQAGKAGRFLGENTMYNGNGFHQQKFIAKSIAPDAFKAWLAKAEADGTPLDAAIYKALARRGSREQFVATLHRPKSDDASLYLNRVPATLFASVVRATRKGTAVTPESVAMTTMQRQAAPARGKAP